MNRRTDVARRNRKRIDLAATADRRRELSLRSEIRPRLGSARRPSIPRSGASGTLDVDPQPVVAWAIAIAHVDAQLITPFHPKARDGGAALDQ